MNERIQELAEQARSHATTRHPVSNVVLSVNSEKFEEKFAQLIVEECCNMFVELGMRPADLAAKDVKKYFGVEEQQKVASKPKCSVCGTTENVKYMGGHQPYLCDSVDCIPF